MLVAATVYPQVSRDRMRGVTLPLRQHSSSQVGERPTTFIMDTPGVMLPHVTSHKVGMRLALTGQLLRHFWQTLPLLDSSIQGCRQGSA